MATESLRGWRCLTVEDNHKAVTWFWFVARLMDTTHREAKKVRRVRDTLSAHKLRFFCAYFPPVVAQACLRRLEIICTTAHGSWLNTAEMEFSVLS